MVQLFDNNQVKLQEAKNDQLVTQAGGLYKEQRKNHGAKHKELYKDFAAANRR